MTCWHLSEIRYQSQDLQSFPNVIRLFFFRVQSQFHFGPLSRKSGLHVSWTTDSDISIPDQCWPRDVVEVRNLTVSQMEMTSVRQKKKTTAIQEQRSFPLFPSFDFFFPYMDGKTIRKHCLLSLFGFWGPKNFEVRTNESLVLDNKSAINVMFLTH